MSHTVSTQLIPPWPTPPDRLPGLVGLLHRLRRNPLECWSAEFFREPIVRIRLPLLTAYIVSDPEAIRRVLMDNAANYRKDPIQRRILANGLADGLLSVEDERWETQRRTLAPLLAKRTVISFSSAIRHAAEQLAGRWEKLCDGTILDVAAEMTLVTLNVLALTIFSDGIGGDPEDFRSAMNAYFGVIGRIGIFDLMGLPASVPRPGRARLRRTMAYFEGVIDGLIETRRRRMGSFGAAPPNDLLTLLLRADDPTTGRAMSLTEVRSNILTFLSAGHETTANALAWSIFLLSQSPEWRMRVREEARRELDGPVEGLADRLVVTKAVVQEALRLYPPIAALSRTATEPDTIGQFQIGRGALVVIAPYVLHRHSTLWDRPEVFDPARFLGDAKREVPRFAYLPFGIGPRTCIGASFALQEATIVLAVLMERFELALAPDAKVWPVQSVTLRPAYGIPMRLMRRGGVDPLTTRESVTSGPLDNAGGEAAAGDLVMQRTAQIEGY
ncbi:cytochrome P450 [uncultured Bradyrhizobium sp.]|jgi:cytochrome P450|uniref:cytochrome P450 n=1 Tax=uncultured Bradyrhizobium sp. TaxID=199684 RepID=UPI00261B5159|nr:cytochrome P450 [uncultured Bradyrhizobium sp.]